MHSRFTFFTQLAFTLFLLAFLFVPMGLSIAGVTANYIQGLQSGVTLRWIYAVWELYQGTIYLSLLIAISCLAVTLIIGVPLAYVLAKTNHWSSRLIEELLVTPLAIPGLAIALALIITYGGTREFRMSWLLFSSATSSIPCASWWARCWRCSRPSTCAPLRRAPPVSASGSGSASLQWRCPIADRAFSPAR